jgi:hypothetical protein
MWCLTAATARMCCRRRSEEGRCDGDRSALRHPKHDGFRSWDRPKYQGSVDGDEFTKFVTLMRNLSPFVLLLIDPQSRSRRQDRNPPNREAEFTVGPKPPSRRGAAL